MAFGHLHALFQLWGEGWGETISRSNINHARAVLANTASNARGSQENDGLQRRKNESRRLEWRELLLCRPNFRNHARHATHDLFSIAAA